jgi:Ca-activated chloride channel family protein
MAEVRAMSNIVFLYPAWLWLLPALLALTLMWRALGVRGEASSLATLSADHRLRFLHPLIHLLPQAALTRRASPLQTLLLSLALCLLIVSLAEPVRIGERLPDAPRERDIVFMVDASVSMSLRDYVLDGQRIDRMTLLKAVLDRFVQQLPGERMAVIVFGDSAYTLVPLTRDHDLLRRQLARIETTVAGRFNAIGDAIALGVKQAEAQAERKRVLVLLTDADVPTGAIDPLAAAELARAANLPLYTIAIGATGIEAEEARTAGLIYQPVDAALLAALSQRTGARSYQASDAQALEQAIADISQHETNVRELPPRFVQEPLYHWPLLLALTLVSLAPLSRLTVNGRP